MNTIKDDRNNEDKNDYNLKNVMSVDFIALRKLLLLSQKNLHLFFCQNKNWYKTFKSILYQYHVSFMSWPSGFTSISCHYIWITQYKHKPVQIIQTIDRKHFQLSIDIKYQSFPHQTKIW